MDGVVTHPDIGEAQLFCVPRRTGDRRGPRDAAVLGKVDADSHERIQPATVPPIAAHVPATDQNGEQLTKRPSTGCALLSVAGRWCDQGRCG
ncbi:hypothetical protein QOZ89_36955 [Pseudofrankia sp. BMG5.37]|nr:hypothetical protein [Pseudofrankia sp. BMG5.37]MDT3445146.1 hypothetical protein [Pseudofrankia sp. BMG5.37]